MQWKSALLVTSLVACAPEAPSDLEFAEQQTGTDADGGTGGDFTTGEAQFVPSIDGTWLQWSEISTCIDLFGSREGISRTLFVIESDQNEQGFVSESWRACILELPVVIDLETFAGPGLMQSVYPVESEDGFVSGTVIGAGYASGLLSEPWGLDMEDPVHEPFPTTTDDARIVDADRDGNPGVTVLVSTTCETYIAQRAITQFTGNFVDFDRIEGTMVSYTDQLTVGFSEGDPFCATRYETRPNDVRNRFIRIRIDGQGNAINLDANGDGEFACDEVLDFAEATFDRTLPDDEACFH